MSTPWKAEARVGERRRRADKVHKIPREDWDRFVARAEKGVKFVLTVEIQTTCGLPGYTVSPNWDRVTCLRCLKLRKRPARARGGRA